MSVWGGESIHNAIISGLASAPLGKKITKFAFTWTAGLQVETIKAYAAAELLFTLTFTWNGDGTLNQVVRS